MQLARVVYSSLVLWQVPGEGDVVPTQTEEQGQSWCSALHWWVSGLGLRGLRVSDRNEMRNDPA